MAERIRFEQEGDVGSIVVDSPPLNLFGEGMGEELQAALGEAEGAGLRALVFRAEGKVFTGGVDVQIFEGLSGPDAESLAHELLAITQRVEDMPFPTISSVGGLCLTWGFELSLACDLIIAADAARFGLVERVVGITPFMGGVQRVTERAGPARARELVMTGDLYPAETLRAGVSSTASPPLVELEEQTLSWPRAWRPGPRWPWPPPSGSSERRSTRAPAAPTSARRRSPARCSRPMTPKAAIRSLLRGRPGQGHLRGPLSTPSAVSLASVSPCKRRRWPASS